MDKIDSLICSLLRSGTVRWPDDVEKIDEFVERAWHHGVLPLLHELLSTEENWSDYPEYLQTSFSDARKNSVAISMVRERAVAHLFNDLLSGDVKPLLLKGEALAHTHYSSPELRVRCDTDIFISLSSISRTIQVLESVGYSISHPRYKSHQFTAVKSMLQGVSFQVDVHWRISNAAEFAGLFSYEACFDRAMVIDVAGSSCHVLHPVHALLHACLHLSIQPEEQADRLIWLYDIHLLVSGLSEDELLEMAELAVQKGLGGICLQPLLKCEECLATPVSKAVFKSLRSTSDGAAQASRYSKSYLALILADLKELPELSQKLELIGELLFPGSGWLLNKYSKTGPVWVPVLYFRYIVGGLFRRLLLK